MSEREFDAYLKLLAGLLQLGPEQRERIAAELRDHMEDRLESLLAAGYSRDDAVAKALEEFGDAAALAGSFRQLAWNRKKRFIMRCTAASVCGVLTIILAAAAFWPGGQPGGAGIGPGQVQAQGNSGAALASQDATDRNAGTRKKLETRLDSQFQDVPLEQVIGFYSEALGVQFYLHEDELANIGVDRETTNVNLNLKDVRTDMALDLMLSAVDCGYYMRDGIVIITSKSVADTQLVLRVYDCGDLIADDPVYAKPQSHNTEVNPGGMGAGGGTGDARPRETELSLVDLIKRSTAHRDGFGWLEEGTGAGTIYRYNNKIVVNQTEEVHAEIECLLDHLRTQGRSQAGPQ